MMLNEEPNAENDEQEAENDPAYQDREEYLTELRQWLDEARLWHGYCAAFPQYANLRNETGTNAAQINAWNNIYPTRPLANNHLGINGNNVPVFQQGTYEFVIPPLWKRIVAEFLDFLILLIIKMTLTFIVIEMFYIVSIENYGVDSFMKNLQDPKIAMQMSVEILTLEILHRFIVCCYEIYWLRGGICATPGKKYMGLIVVKVDHVTAIPGRADDVVRVTGCGPLGFQRAVIRAVLKNIFLGVMLPMCFYIIRFNRTGYDAASNSLVVELNPNNHPVPQ